ncbi:hypothetical protein [Paenibacillus agilis]|uniref:hypothetical protein n=1 Tax=Paenibacillus agilis TaxID=3020863 RepID=UPI001649CD7E|nr:hypothetical protein [Paenibacillus agilis]
MSNSTVKFLGEVVNSPWFNLLGVLLFIGMVVIFRQMWSETKQQENETDQVY